MWKVKKTMSSQFKFLIAVLLLIPSSKQGYITFTLQCTLTHLPENALDQLSLLI